MENLLLILIILAVAILLVWLVNHQTSKKDWEKPQESFPESWRHILMERIPFYRRLSAKDKKWFEFKVHEFLSNCRITPIKTEIDDTDKLLIASSAVIPIFAFPDWQYQNLFEVLVYPRQFNEDFDIEGGDRNVLGMVGNGYMDGKMILSKEAVHQGFQNEMDKKNTAIHEFVHLIDKADGSIDGLPGLLVEKQYIIPWLDLIEKKISQIFEGQSDINPYATTNKSEFFAVLGEYFFERPALLRKKHPELYQLLKMIFKQEAQQHAERNPKKIGKIGRNDPCPCGSGNKFKYCCGKVHY